MRIAVNRNPCGWRRNMLFALAALADGLVRTLSLGLLFSDCQLSVSRETARLQIQKAKAQRKEPK